MGKIQVSDTPDKFLYPGSIKMPGICMQQGGKQMTGREPQKENDLFFTCSLIDYIARKTKNRRCDGFIEESQLKNGSFDNISAAMYAVPSHWDIGKVYKRLILGIAKEKKISVIDALFEAYHSFVSDKIDDYNSSFYYEVPQNILCTFLNGKLE